MLVKIKSYKPHNQCYGWYGHLVGRIVNVRKKLHFQEDYIVDDPCSGSYGTIFDSAIHKSNVEILDWSICK